ncbi:MAG TPA: HNH endonuclease [Desulfobulbaceae bacterium]|nr:MAG: HNH endonuclease [Deltaproteobacteria bacterium RIFOXYD12_FULL_53_23]HCC55268.1 HNH endonuclease [Desulfobulbaceae bacterium]
MPPREPGARKKIKAFLLQHVGEVLESDDIRAASGNKSEWARRVRELRNEEGMNIVTHNDRSDLRPGQYLLIDTKIFPSFARTMSKEIRAYVLDRNGFTCQMCGIAAGDMHPFDGRKARLHIGHIKDKSQGGDDAYSNLRALCSVCNEGAANITLDRPTAIKLLSQIRRAPNADQIAVLEWLVSKFPKQAAERLK